MRTVTLIILLSIHAAMSSTIPRPHMLRVQHMNQPIGIDQSQPFLSWNYDSADTHSAPPQNMTQQSFQIRVATQRSHSSRYNCERDTADMWDSGVVNAVWPAPSSIIYGGGGSAAQPLIHSTDYVWCARWTAIIHSDENDSAVVTSEWSDPSRFGTALFDASSDSPAQWLTGDGYMYRTTFDLDHSISDITLIRAYISGLGWYETYLNGEHLSSLSVLDPGWTNYQNRSLYSTYDIPTTLLQPNNNSIVIMCGGGHFSEYWLGSPYLNKSYPQRTTLWATIDVRYQPTQQMQRIVSNSNEWQISGNGPIIDASVYGGETFDFRIKPSDDSWSSALLTDNFTPELSSQLMPPIRVTEQLLPIRRWFTSSKTMLVDFGQNFAGWLRIRIRVSSKLGRSGDTVILQHSELLYDNNQTLNVWNLGLARQIDTFILDSSAVDTMIEYHPRFTVHGFRYASVTVQPDISEEKDDESERRSITIADIVEVYGMVVHSDVESIGQIGFSDDTLTSIQRLIRWSARSNLMSLPTDCPQRDERLGWLADAHVSAPAITKMFDVSAFYAMFIQNMIDSQLPGGEIPDFVPDCDEEDGDPQTQCNRGYTLPGDPAWSAAFPFIMFQHLLTYHFDTTTLTAAYPYLVKYVQNQQLSVDPQTGLLTRSDFGDWNAIFKVDGQLVSGVIQCLVLQSMFVFATVLGLTEDATHYHNLTLLTRQAYHKAYYNTTKRGYQSSSPADQSANIMPLYAEIVPDTVKDDVIHTLLNAVINGQPSNDESHDNNEDDTDDREEGQYPLHLHTGVISLRMLWHTLTSASINRYDLALTLATQLTYPSIGYFVVSDNSTTLWENWSDTLVDPEGTSRNHIMFGSIAEWFFDSIAGIAQPHITITSSLKEIEKSVGYATVQIAPPLLASNVSLEYAGSRIRTVRGTVSAVWTQQLLYSSYVLRVRIPVNARARITLPASAPLTLFSNGELTDADSDLLFVTPANSIPIKQLRFGEMELGSGDYTFRGGSHSSQLSTICATSQPNQTELTVRCSHNSDAMITAVLFASFGRPVGECGFQSFGQCHSPNSRSVVSDMCIGRNECTISATVASFGVDPNCDVSIAAQWLTIHLQCGLA